MSPTLCSLLKTLPPGIAVISTALFPSHLAITICSPEIAKKSGFFSCEKELPAGAMLACVLNPTVAPHSFSKITMDLLPSGDGIELRTMVLHAPKSLTKYVIPEATTAITAQTARAGMIIRQMRCLFKMNSVICDLDRAADAKRVSPYWRTLSDPSDHNDGGRSIQKNGGIAASVFNPRSVQSLTPAVPPRARAGCRPCRFRRRGGRAVPRGRVRRGRLHRATARIR